MKNKLLLLAPILLLTMAGCSAGPVDASTSQNQESSSQIESSSQTSTNENHELPVNEETFTMLKNYVDGSNMMHGGSISTVKTQATYLDNNKTVTLTKGTMVTLYRNGFTLNHTNKKEVKTGNTVDTAQSFKAIGIEEAILYKTEVTYVSDFRKDETNPTGSTNNSQNPIGLATTSFKSSELSEQEYDEKETVVKSVILANAKESIKNERLVGILDFYDTNIETTQMTITNPFDDQYKIVMTYKVAEPQANNTYLYSVNQTTLRIANHNIVHQEDQIDMYEDVNLTKRISTTLLKYNLDINESIGELKTPDLSKATQIDVADYPNYYSLNRFFGYKQAN